VPIDQPANKYVTVERQTACSDAALTATAHSLFKILVSVSDLNAKTD
jgi:hypothetical protein